MNKQLTKDDILILAIYVNIGNLDDKDVEEHIINVANIFKLDESEHFIKQYIIPVRDQESKVECLNPSLMKKNDYEKVKKQLEIIENKFNKIMEDIPTDPPKQPTKPSLRKIVKEGTIGDCLKCGSTTIKRFIWFGKSIGCIQSKCSNYFN